VASEGRRGWLSGFGGKERMVKWLRREGEDG
jgi:hypothetical protein